MADPLRIAVAGLGTVGGGVLKLIAEHDQLIRERAGRRIEVVAVSARSRGKNRGVALDRYTWFDDPVRMAAEAPVDAVVELIGGADGVARRTCEAAIARGRHVVTANKALLAHHGTELALQAEAAGVALAYEAAVGGGIPIIKALREGLAGNRIKRIYGILNGTCNYILTTMRQTGRAFDDVLAEAQALGYAEAEPSLDVDGFDAAHKLAILASLAFGCQVNFAGVHVEGIRHVSPLDIRFAEELGYRIKLLGIASMAEGGVEQRVHPCMVPLSAPIAYIEGVFNAVVADGDFVDTIMQEGRGAGAGPTASAVAADLIDIARGRVLPAFSIPATGLKVMAAAPMARHQGAYYVRLMVVDQPGVFAEIAAALRDYHVSMEQVLQRARAPHEPVPVVLTTHETREEAMGMALDQIARIGAVTEPPTVIRIEML